MWELAATFNWKDLWPVFLPAVVSIYLGHMAIQNTRAENRRKAADARAKETREREDRESREEQDEDAAQATNLTARFKALMDGYEARIREISTDNTSLKSEMRDYRQRYESHQRMCAGCPHYASRIARTTNAEPTG